MGRKNIFKRLKRIVTKALPKVTKVAKQFSFYGPNPTNPLGGSRKYGMNLKPIGKVLKKGAQVIAKLNSKSPAKWISGWNGVLKPKQHTVSNHNDSGFQPIPPNPSPNPGPGPSPGPNPKPGPAPKPIPVVSNMGSETVKIPGAGRWVTSRNFLYV